MTLPSLRLFTIAAALTCVVTFIAGPAGARADSTNGSPALMDSKSRPDERGTQLAWSRFVDLDFSAARIVIRRFEGGPVRELTHSTDGVQDIDPKFSPDGSRILFERDKPDGTTDIVVVNTDGTGEHVLPLGCVDPCAADVSPTWGPDGNHVYFSRVVGPFDQPNGSARSAVLWRSRLNGTGLTRITPPGVDPTYEEYLASFAPAGYMIFLRIRNADIKSAAFRMDPGGRVTQLTDYSLDADELSVSPAAKGPSKDLVVFETFGHGAPEGVAAAVATVPATCGGVSRCASKVHYLTSAKSLPDQHFNPTWAPDGRQIAYVHFSFVEPGPATGDIWRMAWNGRHKAPVSTSPLFEFRPAWGAAPRGSRH